MHYRAVRPGVFAVAVLLLWLALKRPWARSWFRNVPAVLSKVSESLGKVSELHTTLQQIARDVGRSAANMDQLSRDMARSAGTWRSPSWKCGHGKRK